MESSPDSYVLLDSELNYVEVNQAGLKASGNTKKEIIGKNILDIIPTIKETGRYDKYLEVMKTGRPYFIDDLVPHPRFGDIHVSVGAFKAGDGLGLIVTDITERKRMEETLRKHSHDLGERFKELNCLYGISNLVEKRGITLEEILQGTVNLIPPSWQYPEITCARVILDDQQFKTDPFEETIWKQTSDIIVHGRRAGILEACYREEKPESDEGPFLKEERVLINAVAERLGRIIEHKRMEEALWESEERMRLAMEGTEQGIWDWDMVSGKIFLNDDWPRVLGYEPGEIDFDFKWWKKNVHPESIPVFEEALKAYLDGRKKYYELEYRIQTKSSSWKWIWARGVCIAYDKNGKPLRMIGTQQDITYQKLIEEKIQKTNDQLRRLSTHLQTIREDERKRIAADCKDEEYNRNDRYQHK
ncbi:hypothetical protein ES703_103318 [subsurface metagenome]